MNYAEDRLDRRARMIDMLEGRSLHLDERISKSWNEHDSYPSRDCYCSSDDVYSASTDNKPNQSTKDSIHPGKNKDWSKNSLVVDLTHAHSMIRDALLNSNRIEASQVSKMGHELAGRTLRDCGLCANASFHYAMAWMCDVLDADRAGDYAQMAEFCGRPDMGIHSLLFYRSGGNFNPDFFTYSDQITVPVADSQHVVHSFLFDDSCRNTHCGCGMDPCGKREFYIPYDMEANHMYQDIIETMEALRSALYNEPRKSLWDASAVYEKTFANIPSDNGIMDTTDGRLNHGCFDSLRFWESQKHHGDDIDNTSNLESSNIKRNGLSECKEISYKCITDESIEHASRRSILHQEYDIQVNPSQNVEIVRLLPPHIQLLLLKLLYVSPMGGPYLYLACEAVPHISALISRSSTFSQIMAERYKSHWAYFTFIRHIVLGERMKKHRRNHTPYHIPVWDIVHHLDSRHIEPIHDIKYHQSLRMEPRTSPRCHNPLSDHIISRHQPLFALGDSHVISVGWQTIRISSTPHDEFRLIVPLPVTGLKAWHVREGTKFFTHYNLHKVLVQLPSWCRSIVFSAGEIDCREGIGGEKLEGYEDSCTEEVIRTVREYVNALTLLSRRYQLQILVMPVAPHAARNDKNGRKLGRVRRRERMMIWNDALREECKALHENNSGPPLYLLDYEKKLRYPDKNSIGFVLNPVYNADYTHMNSAFLPFLEEALIHCGCVLQLL